MTSARLTTQRERMIRIFLNGEPRLLPPQTTLAGLIEQAGLAGRRIAVELNGHILPRSTHASRIMAEGDRVEVVHAQGGG